MDITHIAAVMTEIDDRENNEVCAIESDVSILHPTQDHLGHLDLSTTAREKKPHVQWTKAKRPRRGGKAFRSLGQRKRLPQHLPRSRSEGMLAWRSYMGHCAE